MEYDKRPQRTLRFTISLRFFSKKQILPCAISTMRVLSVSQQLTVFPNRKASGNHCAQVPGTVDSHVHCEQLPMERRGLTICKDRYSA